MEATAIGGATLTLTVSSTDVTENREASPGPSAPANAGQSVDVTVTIEPVPFRGNRYSGCNLRSVAEGTTATDSDYAISTVAKSIRAASSWTNTFRWWVIDDTDEDGGETLVLEAFCGGISEGNPPPIALSDLDSTRLSFIITDNDSLPAKPTGLSAVAGDGEALLSWNDPGNTSITGYRLLQLAETVLTASDGATGDNFGDAVAVDGNTIVVGAHGGRRQSHWCRFGLRVHRGVRRGEPVGQAHRLRRRGERQLRRICGGGRGHHRGRSERGRRERR